jgi:peptide/nickel transport system substrate-binding protein
MRRPAPSVDNESGCSKADFAGRRAMKFPCFQLLAVFALATSTALAQQDLTVVWGEDSGADATYDPRVTQSRHEMQQIVQMFDTLIASDESNKLYPGLAKSWSVAPDAKSITLLLREDVKFHDGTPFNAEAVKFNFDTTADPKLGSQAAVDYLGPYESSEVLGPYEIKVNYKRPYGPVAAMLSESLLSIVSPSAVKKLGNDGFAQAPVGTGPFKFVSWEHGRQLVMERNDDYNWAPSFMKRQGPSAVKKLVSRFIPEAGTRVAALESGEIDVSDLTPALDMRRFADGNKFKTMIGDSSGLPFGVQLNASRGIFQDARVRQAFIMSVDRKRMAQNLFFGSAKPAFGPLSSTSPSYWPDVEKYYSFDRKKAEALLEEAGWKMGPGGIRLKDGQPLAAVYYVPPPLEPETAVAVQAEAKRVGFDIKVENITFARNTEIVFANTYDMLPLRFIHGDPSVLEIMFHSRNIPEPGKYKFNWPRWNDPALDKLLETAGGTLDGPKRDELYHQAQKMVMDAAIWFPMHNQVETIAYNARLAGLRFARTSWNVRFYEVTAAQ